MSGKERLIEEAFKLLSLAIGGEQKGEQAGTVLANYEGAIQHLQSAVALEHDPSKKVLLETKISEYSQRANELSLLNSLPETPTSTPIFPEEEKEIHGLYSTAIGLDEQGNRGDALPIYIETAEKLLGYIRTLESQGGPHITSKLSRFKRDAVAILDRVEQLKAQPKQEESKVEQKGAAGRKPAGRTSGSGAEAKSPGPPAQPKSGTGGLTAAEIQTLMASSIINGRVFQPWLDSDMQENFHFSSPWDDPEGILPLSAKQTRFLKGWFRPSELFPSAELCMISSITPDSIKQDLVTDCSFVASLCITAAFEARFRRQLITRIIYPQDENGVPVYNPSGKYMVKLWVNGVARKVLVDDKLPVDRRDNRPLCSMSTVPGELWVSIIEKAYMKVNGGYDFPGSNSGIDLFALTGWIPEGIQLEKLVPDSDDYEKVWTRLLSAHQFGDCLITVNTANLGNEDDTEEERTGLISSHAYAVLDVRDIDGYDGPAIPGMPRGTTLRMLKIKNPWAKKTWKGLFSRTDIQHWTPKLQRELAYNPEQAQMHDDGIFWMEYRILCKFFHSLNLNWNPELFGNRAVLHANWPVQMGPKNDSYNLGENPQYSLVINPPEKGSKETILSPSVNSPTVWVLLSRHVINKEADPKDGDFLTLHLYGDTRGQRVFYPSKPMIRGTYSNNPHSLISFDVQAKSSNESSYYTIVVSQYEKNRDVSYTLNVFCTSPFRLFHTPVVPEHQQRIKGSFTSASAGGSMGRPTFFKNPQYALSVQSNSTKVHFQLQAPKEYSINLALITRSSPGQRVDSVAQGEEVLGSGSYRPGFCFAAGVVNAGLYTLVCSTYKPNQLGSFILTLCSSKPSVQIRAIPPEGDGMQEQEFRGTWSHADGTAVGCSNFGNYLSNPCFQLILPQRSSLLMRVSCPIDEHIQHPALNVTLFQADAHSGILIPSSSPKSSNVVGTSNEGIYTDAKSGASTGLVTVDAGTYYAIISTFDPLELPYLMKIFSSGSCHIQQVRVSGN